MTYPDTISLEARVTKLGNTSFTMGYRAVSQAQKKLVAEGEAVVVRGNFLIDAESNLRAALRAFTADAPSPVPATETKQ